jgi:hypothetical protein
MLGYSVMAILYPNIMEQFSCGTTSLKFDEKLGAPSHVGEISHDTFERFWLEKTGYYMVMEVYSQFRQCFLFSTRTFRKNRLIQLDLASEF